MSKRASGRKPKTDRPIAGETAPPLLSEKLIAQLQNAVSAAQNKRKPAGSDFVARSPEKQL